MTPERENMIRAVWEESRRLWPPGAERFRAFEAPSGRPPAFDGTVPPDANVGVLTFEIERLRCEPGVTLKRVVCEGVALTGWRET